MNKNYLFLQGHIWLLLCLFLLLSQACKTGKTAKAERRGAGMQGEGTSQALIEAQQGKDIEFDWLAAKFRVEFTSPEESGSATLNLRMRKDSIIWFTIKKLGVEGLRVCVYPKYVEILNHNENVYMRRPLSFLAEQLQLPLGFAEIQAFFIGQSFVPPSKKAYLFKTEDDFYKLEQRGLDDYMALLYHKKSLNLERILRDQGQNSVDVFLEEYKQLGAGEIAYTRRIVANSPDLGEITLQIALSKITLNEEQKTKFRIPSHYEKRID